LCDDADRGRNPNEDEQILDALHSHGVDDLFRFCMDGARRVAKFGTIETAFDIFGDVMTRYCDTVIHQCERILVDAAPVRNDNAPKDNVDQAAEIAGKGLQLGWRGIKKMRAMVEQRTINANVQESSDDEEDDGQHAKFTVPADFWVRLNNLWVLSERRVEPLAVDASQLFDVRPCSTYWRGRCALNVCSLCVQLTASVVAD